VILTTSSAVAGHRVSETKGMVRGSTIRARHLGKDIIAMLRSLVGGEIKEYTHMMAHSREEAIQRMIEAAEDLGANAITDVRFSTSMILSNTAEVLAYGTAVVVVKD